MTRDELATVLAGALPIIARAMPDDDLLSEVVETVVDAVLAALGDA